MGIDGTGTNSSASGETVDGGSGPLFVCEPGEVRCSGQGFIETCLPTGLEWMSEPCGLNQFCEPCGDDDTCAQDRCVGPCELEADLPSSAGCSFVITRGLHIAPDNPDGVIVANPSTELTAVVQLYYTPTGERKEEPVGDPIVLEPLDDFLFEINTEFGVDSFSMFRTGGVHRVESNAPIVAYLHGPLAIDAGNESSMLLPESTARRKYVVFTYNPNSRGNQGQGEPSWFEIVALEDFTTVTWTPTYDTSGIGVNIKAVDAGNTSEPLPMNRFETARVSASREEDKEQGEPDLRDIAGTVIESDRPILVWSGNRCSRVPMRDQEMYGNGRCDPLQELLIPIDYWGERYVAGASSQRENERHYWRIFAGYSDITVTTEPQVLTEEACTNTGTMDNTWEDGSCVLNKRGSFFEIDVSQGTNFFISGTAPNNAPAAFMPVQYLQSAYFNLEPTDEKTDIGDAAMVQTIPVEQYLKRYVFATGVGYRKNFVQVVRQRDSAAVYLDNGDITFPIPDAAYVPVNDTYEVANYELELAESELTTGKTFVIYSNVAFGITQMGWTDGSSDPVLCNPENPNPGEEHTCYAAYAYPGGMKSEQINIP